MSKGINFIIPLVIYPFDVMVSIGQSDDELEKVLSNYDLMDTDNAHLYSSVNSPAMCAIFPGNQTLLRMREVPETPEGHGYLQHEIFHAATFIMHRVGMRLVLKKSDEAYSYLIQYLTTKIHTELYSYKK